jgi:hypothetical protein
MHERRCEIILNLFNGIDAQVAEKASDIILGNEPLPAALL